MKQVVSVSLGSSKRDHQVEITLLGQKVKISRRGTDGDFKRAVALLRELDGQVEAIGLGGIDLYLVSGQRKYAIRDGKKLLRAVKKTPIVDGSGLKNTLERQTVAFLQKQKMIQMGTRVLMVSAVDRFGMAQSFHAAQCEMVFGDLLFSTPFLYPIRSLKSLERLARLVLPFFVCLPFKMLYPTGKKQEEQDFRKIAKLGKYYREAEIIAGDFHFIRKFLPHDLNGQTVVTNTTTAEDQEFLRNCGVKTLVTTTPVLEGRSFGTNVMEALLLALSGRQKMQEEDYVELLKQLNFAPTVTIL